MKKIEEGNPPPKRHAIRRFADRFRKQNGSLTPLADFPSERCAEEPPRAEFKVSMKKKLSIKKKYVAILDKGVLELHQRKKVDHGGLSNAYHIDLSKVNLMHDEERIVVRFQVESLLLKPLEGTFQNFKEAIHRHRLWRQEQRVNESEPKVAPSKSTVTASTDFRTWEMDGVYMRLLESIKEMNAMTLAVLEKSTKQLEEARSIADELRKMNNGTTTAATTTPATTTATVTSAPTTATTTVPSNNSTPQTKATSGEVSADEDSEVESEVEEQNELTKPGESEILYSLEAVRSDIDFESKRKPEMLYSLEAVSFVEAASKRALAKTKKVLEEPKAKSPQMEKTLSEKRVRPKEKPKEAKRRRECLPCQQPPSEGIGFKTIVHLALTKSGLPLNNYEPIGSLQLLCEELTWSRLLDLAASQRLPEDRLSFVAAFAMSPYCCSAGRSRKPFNPLLGETFDYEEAGWRFHGEQVCHHPAITVGHAEHKNWTWWNTMHLETNVNKWSKSVEVSVDSPIRLILRHSDGVEEYSWNKVRSKIENITSAPEQRKISHEGLMQVRCSNGYSARLYFKKCKDPKELIGDVLAPNDRMCYRLQGTWDRRLTRQRTTGEWETLFDCSSLERFPHFYGFSRFTLGLNEMEAGIPQSDSRYRQDMRALENGNVQVATEAKEQLEKTQRNRAKGTQREQSLWFESQTDEMTKKRVFVANGRYWKAKKKGFEGYRERMLDLSG